MCLRASTDSGDHDRGRHAGRGRMMLVDHDVEAELVGEQPLVVIAVEQVGRDFRIELAVRQIDAQRAVVVWFQASG